MLYIKEVYNSMFNVSRVIIKISLTIVCLIFTIGLGILFFAEQLFADYTTGHYWFEQFMFLGKEMLGATIVPVMFFELFAKILIQK